MRSFVVGIIVALAACNDQRGARVIVEGAVKFDHVELFFGRGGSRSVPITPSRAADPAAQVQAGDRYNRVAAPEDVVAATETVTRLDLIFAPGDEAAEYLGIVAYRGAVPVGIGEVLGLAIPDDKLLQYVVTLAPYETEKAEVWGEGAGPKCLYWSKAGREPIAVVRGGDPDCDELKGPLDCSPNAYCVAGQRDCAQRPTLGDGSCAFVDEANNCIVGHCIEGIGCSAEICGTPEVCDAACETEITLEDRFACATEVAASQPLHVEIVVPVGQTDVPCPTVVVRLPMPTPGVSCVDARLEYPAAAVFPALGVMLDPVANVNGECVVLLSPRANMPLPEHQHAYVTIAANGALAPSLAPRWSLIVGVERGPRVVCPDGAMVEATVVVQGEVATCPMAP